MTTDTTQAHPILIDVKTVCHLLSISRSSYFVAKSLGRIGPCEIKLGKKILLRADEVTAWVEQGCPPRRQWRWKGNR